MATARRPARDPAPPKRTVWHVFFAALLRERRSPDFDVLVEVPLASEPPRADVLLVRKRRRHAPPAAGRVLRGLWPRLGSDTLVEFKSPARPLRRGDLIRLLGYGAQYHAEHVARLGRGEPGLVLVVPRLSRALGDELGRLGWRLGADDASGYHPIEGGPYRAWAISLDQVGRAEQDEVLVPLVEARLAMQEGGEAWGWWQTRLLGPGREADMPDVSKLEGYDELVMQMLARVPPARLARVLAKAPARVLAHLPTEALAAGLTVEQLAALPAETLAALPAEKRLAGLSVRERLAGLSADELAALRAELLGPQAAKKPKKRRPKASR